MGIYEDGIVTRGLEEKAGKEHSIAKAWRRKGKSRMDL